MLPLLNLLVHVEGGPWARGPEVYQLDCESRRMVADWKLSLLPQAQSFLINIRLGDPPMCDHTANTCSHYIFYEVLIVSEAIISTAFPCWRFLCPVNLSLSPSS